MENTTYLYHRNRATFSTTCSVSARDANYKLDLVPILGFSPSGRTLGTSEIFMKIIDQMQCKKSTIFLK
ncbi:MAG: hypothetical protein ISS14_02105 [Actinobacteria bacterium]|nr:hypothetical protein [Actinomycetota bacterium]